MYKTPKLVTQKTLREIAPQKISPPGGLYLKNGPQIQSKAKQKRLISFQLYASPIDLETQISLRA